MSAGPPSLLPKRLNLNSAELLTAKFRHPTLYAGKRLNNEGSRIGDFVPEAISVLAHTMPLNQSSSLKIGGVLGLEERDAEILRYNIFKRPPQ